MKKELEVLIKVLPNGKCCVKIVIQNSFGSDFGKDGNSFVASNGTRLISGYKSGVSYVGKDLCFYVYGDKDSYENRYDDNDFIIGTGSFDDLMVAVDEYNKYFSGANLSVVGDKLMLYGEVVGMLVGDKLYLDYCHGKWVDDSGREVYGSVSFEMANLSKKPLSDMI